MKVFLSCSFADRDRHLVSQVEALLKSHGLIVVTGRILGGGPLAPMVKQRIDGSDALVALFTRRENDPSNVTHPWVLQEYMYAVNEKLTVGFYEQGVPVQGAGEGYERIVYDPAAPLGAFLRLSEIVGEWKRHIGRLLKLQVMPEEAARALDARGGQVRCEYRFQSEGDETDWRTAKVRHEVGGVFVYLRVPENVEMVQLRSDMPSYQSAYTPLWMPVHLEPRQ